MNRETAPPAGEYARRALIVTSIVALYAVLLLVAWRVAQVLLLIFGGVLFGVFLRGLANQVAHYTRLPDGAALTAVVVGFLLLGVGGLLALAPQLTEGFAQLAEELPKAVERVRQYVADAGWIGTAMDRVAGAGSEVSPEMLARVAGVFSTAIGAVSGVLIVLALGIYFAVSPRLYTRGLLHLVPTPRQERAAEFLAAVTRGLRWWLLGQFGSMAAIGSLITTGLFLLEVPAALTLGILAGVLTFIPFLGPVIAAAPAILIALLDSPMLAVYVTLLYIVAQSLEGYLITPMIQKRAVYMPPAVLLAAQLILGVWLGFLGVFLAAPLILVVLITVQMLYVEATLGQHVREVWKQT